MICGDETTKSALFMASNYCLRWFLLAALGVGAGACPRVLPCWWPWWAREEKEPKHANRRAWK